MAKLVLVRHGVSEWNKLGLWTGWTDVALAPEGVEEAKRTASTLRDIHFDNAFSADLQRVTKTFETIQSELGYEIPLTIAWEIRERNYGDLTGKNKWDIKEKFGEEQFNKWRRGWDADIPNGENLKQVYERAVPFFLKNVMPLLQAGKNVMVCGSGNSLRSIAKYIENVSDEDIANLEINTAEAFVYEIDGEGKMVGKEVRASNEKKV